jgi:hypothetical protein
VKRHSKEKVEHLPDLEESDVDSDDDVSLSSVQDFDPGGDDRRDHWSQEELLPEQSEAPAADPLPVLPHPPPSPIIAPPDSPPSPQAPEEALNDGLGRSANGKSRRIRAKYNYTNGKKQILPGVRRALYVQKISQKRSDYRKQIAKKRKQANEMMYAAKVEVPSVEALMACPISKFIHFAANDCGYNGTRYDLIANWIHPLFLKAKCEATKADNPNWKATLKVIETLEAMDAWEVVDRDDSTMNVIDSVWAFKLKRFPDGKAKMFKARFCARGDQQLEGIIFF